MASFRDIVGHEQIIRQLQNGIRQKKVSHAYLFCGETGSGKRLMADAFAKTLLCEAGGIEACGTCKSCKQAESGNQPDLRAVVREKASLGVSEIREQVTSDAQIKPYSSAYKVYIIDEADKLTEEAQNALLKTIEEPPEYAVFLLLATKREALLPTVLSRCVTISFYPVETGKIRKFLMEKRKLPDYVAQNAAAFSGGLIGRAILFAESEDFFNLRQDVLTLVKNIDAFTMAEITEQVKKFAAQKEILSDALNMMALWYRDVLLYKATRNVNFLLYSDESEAIMARAEKQSYEKLQGVVDRMEQLKQRLKANVNTEMALELLFLFMKED